MCGIVGAVSGSEVSQRLVHCLKRLEYRGYDSAGVVSLNDQGLQRIRVVGKVAELSKVIEAKPLPGTCGLAHTRWATHGKPTEKNAHPHVSNDTVAVVHNGIIDNCDKVKAALVEEGYTFSSETDSEVIAHAIHHALKSQSNMVLALKQCCDAFTGSYSFGVLSTEHPGKLFAVCHGSPLVIGLGKNEQFIASDMVALASMTARYVYMEEGDVAVLSQHQLTLYDVAGRTVERPIHQLNLSEGSTSKGEYRHFMLKEIFEQPAVIRDNITGKFSQGLLFSSLFPETDLSLFDQVHGIQIVACGTSYHAGLVAKYWFEEHCGLPCQVEVASEYRYRRQVVLPNTLFLTISQSGETADTLAALKMAKSLGYLATAVVCNVENSALARLSDFVLLTNAGVEIGVASTKAFTSQLIVLLTLVAAFAQRKGQDIEAGLLAGLKNFAGVVERLFVSSQSLEYLAQKLSHYQHALFLGRHSCYPIAMEGALKLKEISYIHAEAYPAGELKHGPLALVDENMPIIVLAPNHGLIDKIQANVQEVAARGGHLIVLTDAPDRFKTYPNTDVLVMPVVSEALVPLLYTIPLQLLSYHVALVRGTDIDQPRNLAKSVTVE